MCEKKVFLNIYIAVEEERLEVVGIITIVVVTPGCDIYGKGGGVLHDRTKMKYVPLCIYDINKKYYIIWSIDL